MSDPSGTMAKSRRASNVCSGLQVIHCQFQLRLRHSPSRMLSRMGARANLRNHLLDGRLLNAIIGHGLLLRPHIQSERFQTELVRSMSLDRAGGFVQVSQGELAANGELGAFFQGQLHLSLTSGEKTDNEVTSRN